ncbi:MAG: prepilin-type N-terminal cleavage/methylation domain-containing protein [Candidatus Omnitrophica bacterium]|nr:prepilin-type N-terminal cleavage/methylation domain-containing protein [Candidatus Omnitrophota bacterium]
MRMTAMMRATGSGTTRMKRAFTLIELLIVIAIILILVAIALPNFADALLRSKVTKVMADHRALKTALESYQTDYRDYPYSWSYHPPELNAVFHFPEDGYVKWRLVVLTTPIAYMTELPETPFFSDKQKHSDGVIELKYNTGSSYDRVRGWYNNAGPIAAGANRWSTLYHLRDAGPDKIYNNQDNVYNVTNLMPYTPTNGVKSLGDIWTFGP